MFKPGEVRLYNLISLKVGQTFPNVFIIANTVSKDVLIITPIIISKHPVNNTKLQNCVYYIYNKQIELTCTEF